MTMGIRIRSRPIATAAVLGAAMLLAGCQTDGPPGAGPVTQARPDPLADALIVSVPPGVEKAPVVLLLEGTGGSSRMHPTWGPFLVSRGIAVVQIQSAKARGRRNWEGTGCGLLYTGDPRAALETLRNRPEIDTSRFAVMGFSRGGTEALGGARSFAGAAAQPAAVFAFYPGCGGVCSRRTLRDVVAEGAAKPSERWKTSELPLTLRGERRGCSAACRPGIGRRWLCALNRRVKECRMTKN